MADRNRITYYVHRVRLADGKEGWTRVRGERQSVREAEAWRDCGWTTSRYPTSPEVRQLVRDWEKRAKGYPGEAPIQTAGSRRH